MKRAFGVKKYKEPPPSIQDASDRVSLFLTLLGFSLYKIVKWKRVGTLFQASSFMLLFQTGTQEFSPDGHFIVSADRDFKIRVTVFPKRPLDGAHEVQSFCLDHTEQERVLLRN